MITNLKENDIISFDGLRDNKGLKIIYEDEDIIKSNNKGIPIILNNSPFVIKIPYFKSFSIFGSSASLVGFPFPTFPSR